MTETSQKNKNDHETSDTKINNACPDEKNAFLLKTPIFQNGCDVDVVVESVVVGLISCDHDRKIKKASDSQKDDNTDKFFHESLDWFGRQNRLHQNSRQNPNN